MLQKIKSVWQFIVWLLGFALNAVKSFVILFDRISEGAFLLVGTMITVTSAILLGKFLLGLYLAMPNIVLLVVLGVLVLVGRGAVVVWKQLKDVELDTAFHLLASHLLAGLALAWEAVKWIFKKKEVQ